MGLSASLPLVARPAAKVNLTLAVAPRGPDGYHPLRSVFLRIGLTDELVISGAPLATRDSLSVSGLPGCPVEGNLVLRAFALLREALGQPMLPLRAQLDKRIPLGAGLGGGSADGAAALELALAAWGAGLAPSRLAELALALGSDVPFFLADAPAALVEGRGEGVTPLPAVRGGAGVLLATSAQPLSTGAVFARYDDLAADSAGAERATDELAAALRAGLDGAGLTALAGRVRDANDLWPAGLALAPELGPMRDAVEAATQRAWLMSGSGRSLFSLHPSAAEAAEAGRRLAHDRAAALSDVVFHAVGLDGQVEAWRNP